MQFKRSLVIVAALLCYQPYCASQGFRVDPLDQKGKGGYWPKWDLVQDRLLLYRNTIDPEVPAARIFGEEGKSVAVYPLQDLSNSRYIDVWNAAATPDGGLVLAAIVGYTPRGVKPAQLKTLLLTYDGNGRLIRVWDMLPYHYHLVSVDRDGNVFALGDSDLAEPYPLLVKYSPSGKVLRELLPSNFFPEGDKVVLQGSPNGESQMFIRGDDLFVWLASPQELLRFSLAGDLISRTSLAQGLSGLAEASANNRTKLIFLTVTPDGRLVAQVQLWPKRSGDPVRTAMVQLSSTESKATLLPISLDPVWFLGSTRQGKLVFLQPEPGGKAGIIVTW